MLKLPPSILNLCPILRWSHPDCKPHKGPLLLWKSFECNEWCYSEFEASHSSTWHWQKLLRSLLSMSSSEQDGWQRGEWPSRALSWQRSRSTLSPYPSTPVSTQTPSGIGGGVSAVAILTATFRKSKHWRKLQHCKEKLGPKIKDKENYSYFPEMWNRFLSNLTVFSQFGTTLITFWQ